MLGVDKGYIININFVKVMIDLLFFRGNVIDNFDFSWVFDRIFSYILVEKRWSCELGNCIIMEDLLFFK